MTVSILCITLSPGPTRSAARQWDRGARLCKRARCPATTPTDALKLRTAATIIPGDKLAGITSNLLMMAVMAAASADSDQPTGHADRRRLETETASVCCAVLAPIALRIPISLVRLGYRHEHDIHNADTTDE